MRADQCRMSLDNLQEVELPAHILSDKFTFCTWQPGDEYNWIEIVRKAFGDFVSDWTAEKFVERYASTHLFKEDGFFFVKDGNKYVGTAFAWQNDSDISSGILHWVAVIPEYQRRGLARALTLHVLKYHQTHGKESVSLKTEVYRTAAIKLYQDIGFTMCAIQEGKP